MRYRVKVDTRLCILTPGQWPTNHFGDYNEGIVVEAPSEDIAISEVSENTGVSRWTLTCDEELPTGTAQSA